MSYDIPIVVEDAQRFVEQGSATGIDPRYATKAAKMLMAATPAHAGTFAVSMHRRASKSLDTDLIEHWARVVMEISRMG
jgi:hypothetical protein